MIEDLLWRYKLNMLPDDIKLVYVKLEKLYDGWKLAETNTLNKTHIRNVPVVEKTV